MAKTPALFYSVYCFTNSINNKKYIGITSDIKRRFKQHKGIRSRAVVFCLAIKKYGFENFKFEILKENLTLEDAKLFEIQFIQELNSMVPNGYNRTKGGDSSVKHTIATIEKIKEKNRLYRLNNPDPRKGKQHTEETKKLLSKLAFERTDRPKGNNHWNYGKTTSDLTKQKMSVSQTLGNNGFAKKVIDLNTGVIYSCINEAKQVYNISHSFISMVCSGKRKSDKYNFKYLKDYEQEKRFAVNF
jgi:group I intron endonuclease